MQQPVHSSEKHAPLQRRQCKHCATPFTPLHAEDYFCCRGCEGVHALISEQGFAHFYSMRQGISAPAAVSPLEPQAISTLRARQQEAQAQSAAGGSTLSDLHLGISGMHCVGCRWLIAQLFTQQPSHRTIEVNLDDNSVLIHWSEGFDLCAFAQTLNAYGYTLLPYPMPSLTCGTNISASELRSQTRKRLLPRLLLCGVFSLNAFLFSLPQLLADTDTTEGFAGARLFGLVVLLCSTLALGLCVSWLFRRIPTQGSHTKQAKQIKPPLAAAAPTAPDSVSALPTHASSNAALSPRHNTTTSPRILSQLMRLAGYALIVLFLVALFGKSFGLETGLRPEAIGGLSFGVLLLCFVAAK